MILSPILTMWRCQGGRGDPFFFVLLLTARAVISDNGPLFFFFKNFWGKGQGGTGRGLGAGFSCLPSNTLDIVLLSCILSCLGSPFRVRLVK